MDYRKKQVIYLYSFIFVILATTILLVQNVREADYKVRFEETHENIKDSWEPGWKASTIKHTLVLENTDKNELVLDLSQKPKSEQKLFALINEKHDYDLRKESTSNIHRIGEVAAYRTNDWEVEFIDMNGRRGIADKCSTGSIDNSVTITTILLLSTSFILCLWIGIYKFRKHSDLDN